MAIGEIAAVVINTIVELIGIAVFGTTKPTKKQNIVFWFAAFLLVAFLLWLTIAYS